MGKRPRRRPAKMAAKLLRIRLNLGLSQTQLWKRLELDEYLPYTVISGYERGTREPAVEVLLRYARIAGVPMEVLADDALDLPEQLPARANYEWVMRPMRVRQGQK